jgi:predicted lipoprotein with Yx(FWY)xxD motif
MARDSSVLALLLVACGSPTAGLTLSDGDGGNGGERGDADAHSDAADAASDARSHDAGGASTTCLFHSPPVLDPEVPSSDDAGSARDGGDAGDGAASDPMSELEGGPRPAVTIEDSPFVGPHLADSSGFALYVFGADLPGDCSSPPISNCADDCLLSWPPFNAGVRDLAEGLDDAAFGTIERPDGRHQTTYYGWPLYHYKKDEEAGFPGGHGKGVWFAAEAPLPDVLIMRADAASGGAKYLADRRGRTLYVFGSDLVASGGAPPQSACVGECLLHFTPFAENPVGAVSVLEPTLFSSFVRPEGTIQIAYQGKPLYRAIADLRSGDRNGTLTEGWSVVEHD